MRLLPIITFCVVSITIGWPAALHAQSPQIAGRVVDAATDDGLEGANVRLRQEASGQVAYATTTDADGQFVFRTVRAGRYVLIVSYLGYARHTETVEFGMERWTPTIRLEDEALQGEEVVVTVSRAEKRVTPAAVSNVTEQEIEEQGAMKDVPVLLASQPSVTYYTENGNGIGYSTLSMRGFGQRRLAVLVNGIPQNDPEDHNVFWINFFDLQGATTDIQVQRGATSAVNGPTGIGGAINIVATPYRPEPYASVQVGYGTFATQRYTAELNSGLLNDRYVVFGRLSRLLSDGYRDWSWTEFTRFFVGGVRYGERSTLTLQAYGGPQRDGLAYSGIAKADNEDDDARRFNFSSFTEDVEQFHQPHAELLHDWRIYPGWTLNQALFWVKGEGYFDFGGTFRSPDYLRLPEGFAGLSPAERALPLFITAPDVQVLFRAYLDQWQVGWLPRLTYETDRSATTIGLEARLHRSLRWGRIEEATGIPTELVGSDDDVRVYSIRGEKAVGSAFVRHATEWRDLVRVQAEVQATWRQYRVYDEMFFGTDFSKPYTFLNPKLGVTLRPGAPVSAFASFAVARREPRLKQLYDGEEAGAGFRPQFEQLADGSFDTDRPYVSHETLYDVESGVSARGRRYRAAVTGFWMRFDDEIVPSGGLDQFGVPRNGNADATRHTGIELEGAVQATRALELSANATFSRNRILRFTEFVTLADGSTVGLDRSGNPIAGFPERIANARVAYRRGGAVARIDAQTAGRQYIDNSGGTMPDGTLSDDLILPTYTVLNASALWDLPRTWRLGGVSLEGVRLSAEVNNLLNDRVLLYGNVGATGPQFFPLASRQVFFSLRYTVD